MSENVSTEHVVFVIRETAALTFQWVAGDWMNCHSRHFIKLLLDFLWMYYLQVVVYNKEAIHDMESLTRFLEVLEIVIASSTDYA